MTHNEERELGQFNSYRTNKRKQLVTYLMSEVKSWPIKQL